LTALLAADQAVLDVGAGKRAGDQAADQEADAGHYQGILLDGFQKGLAGAIGKIGCGIACRLRGTQPRIGRASRRSSRVECEVLQAGGSRAYRAKSPVLEVAGLIRNRAAERGRFVPEAVSARGER